MTEPPLQPRRMITCLYLDGVRSFKSQSMRNIRRLRDTKDKNSQYTDETLNTDLNKTSLNKHGTERL